VCEVVELAGSHLGYPDVDLAVAIGKKRDESPVTTERGGLFGAAEVREGQKAGFRERVLRRAVTAEECPEDQA
jgi:hypothetical protein